MTSQIVKEIWPVISFYGIQDLKQGAGLLRVYNKGEGCDLAPVRTPNIH